MLVVPSRSSVRDEPIETSRLVIHPLDTTDARDLYGAIEPSRRELEPWLPWVPFTGDLEGAARYAEASAGDWDTARACRFAIRDRGNRRLLGVVGLENFAHLHDACELGYWLRTDATGAGRMTEAARATLGWAFDTLGAHRVRIAAATDNHPSLAVIGRLGFRFEGVSRHAERCGGRWLDHAVFGMLASDRVGRR